MRSINLAILQVFNYREIKFRKIVLISNIIFQFKVQYVYLKYFREKLKLEEENIVKCFEIWN